MVTKIPASLLEEAGGGSTITDHGGLSGLADNDHPQYALRTGATFTGTITVTQIDVTGTGTIDGRDVSVDGTKLDSVQAGAQANTVTSVHGRTGAVVAANNDYAASQISNTPAGNITASTVQAALNELDAEKVATTFGGLVPTGGTTGLVLTKDSGTDYDMSWSASGAASVEVSKNGVSVGTRPEINFIEGSNITLTISDDAGNNEVDVTIAAGAAPSPGGSDTQVQFNDSGAFGGDAGLTYNKTTDTLTVGTDVVIASKNISNYTPTLVASQYMITKSDGSAVEQRLPKWTDGSDTPSAITANGIVKGNAGGTALEMVDAGLSYQEATADGTSTLTLNQQPIAQTQMIVAVDGFLQIPGTAYAVSGTTLTWQTNYVPVNGAQVLIWQFTAGFSIGTLNSLSDVNDSAKDNGYVLTYSESSGEWEAQPSSGGAPSDATYIVQTADAGLSNEQALSSLPTGVVKVTTSTGVLSTAVAGTDYAAPAHEASHVTGGAAEIDGDKIDVDWNPTYYTPSTTPTEADSADNLTAHLYGVDQRFAIQQIATESGTSVTISSGTHQGRYVRCTNGSAVTVTVNQTSLDTNGIAVIRAVGAGGLTILQGTGTPGLNGDATLDQDQTRTLIRVASNEYDLI